MTDPSTIRNALERNVKAVSLRPGVGKGTARTTATLRPGLECEVTEGPWSFTVSMTPKYGGTGSAPNPGVFGRGSLAACLTVGYAMWAARLEVPIERLEVELEADYDVRGELGVDDDVRPGYSAARYRVTVESPASEEDVLRVLDTCDRHSSYLDIWQNRVPVIREVRVTSTASGP